MDKDFERRIMLLAVGGALGMVEHSMFYTRNEVVYAINDGITILETFLPSHVSTLDYLKNELTLIGDMQFIDS